MGLDMFLYGKKSVWAEFENHKRVRVKKHDGFEIKGLELELGYWRKHPNLHGYIVNTFAKGVDECQEIPLKVEDLKKIVEAIKGHNLPQTSGFFFGRSDGSEDNESIKIFEKAIKWLSTQDPASFREVYYRASW